MSPHAFLLATDAGSTSIEYALLAGLVSAAVILPSLWLKGALTPLIDAFDGVLVDPSSIYVTRD